MTARYELMASTGKFWPPGYLEPQIISFSEDLARQGFTSLTMNGYITSISHFGTWLRSKKIPLEKLSDQIVADFAAHNCCCLAGRRTLTISPKYAGRVQRFVRYLALNNIIPLEPDPPPEYQPPLLIAFIQSLYQQGLAVPTIMKYERALKTLLRSMGNDSSVYDSTLVRQVICDEARQRSQGGVKILTSALRKYLRFLAVEGVCPPDLDYAVPSIAQWQISSLPRYISEEAVERVIASCDSKTHKGLRDRAILLLLARMGLRAGDIVNMQLGDIDWPRATLQVRGKSKRCDKLPLPQETGDAVLNYLNGTRPQLLSKYLFLCVNAPHRPFASSSTIFGIVRAALVRAGIVNPPSFGPHLLRHSAATILFRSGASLETVSTILRHRSPDTTAVYAKVNFKMLAEIAQPWPEVTSC